MKKDAMSHRAAVVMALHEEESLKAKGLLYSEAVIQCCKMFLNCFPLRERAQWERELMEA